MDVTDYLHTYNMTARELAMTMIQDVLKTTGITATAGIGTNMYLCKIAMDIVAKHIKADKDGVRIAELDEMSYRRNLCHKLLTDIPGVSCVKAKGSLYMFPNCIRPDLLPAAPSAPGVIHHFPARLILLQSSPAMIFR